MISQFRLKFDLLSTRSIPVFLGFSPILYHEFSPSVRTKTTKLKHLSEQTLDRSSSLTPKCVKFAEEENVPHSGKNPFHLSRLFFLGNTGLHLLCVLECGVSGVAKKKMDAVAIRNT